MKDSFSMISTLLFLAGALFILSGCAGAGHVHTGTIEGIDLIGRLAPIDAAKQNGNINHDVSVTRKGLRKNALALVAPVSVRAPLTGASGKQILEGWATPVFNIGDGIQMDLFLTRAGARHLLMSRYFDAGRKFGDRAWVPISIPIDINENDQLEIVISAGPQGDLVADWLALSGFRLVRRNAGL
jgi:hypothetical protein